jgi:hypothetical protein
MDNDILSGLFFRKVVANDIFPLDAYRLDGSASRREIALLLPQEVVFDCIKSTQDRLKETYFKPLYRIPSNA